MAAVSQNFPRTFYKLAIKWNTKICDLGSRELGLNKKWSSSEPIYKIAYMMSAMFGSMENIAEQMRDLSSQVVFVSETEQVWIYDHRQSDSLPKSNADSQRLYDFVRILVTKWFNRDDANYLLDHNHITTCFFVWYFTTPDLFYKDNVIRQTTRNGIQRVWTPLILNKKPSARKEPATAGFKKTAKLMNTTDTLLPKQQNQQAQLRRDIQALIGSSSPIEWADPLRVHLLISECLAGTAEADLSIKQTKKLQKIYNEYTKLTEKINKTLGKIHKVQVANAKLAPPQDSVPVVDDDQLEEMPASNPTLIRQDADSLGYEAKQMCSGCATNQANQEAHIGGCLPDDIEEDDDVPDSWEDL